MWFSVQHNENAPFYFRPYTNKKKAALPFFFLTGSVKGFYSVVESVVVSELGSLLGWVVFPSRKVTLMLQTTKKQRNEMKKTSDECFSKSF